MTLIATGDQEKRRTRQNRCALMVAAGRLPLLLLNRGIGTGPINVPFGEQHITPATKQFLTGSTRGNPENPGKPSYPPSARPSAPAHASRPRRKARAEGCFFRDFTQSRETGACEARASQRASVERKKHPSARAVSPTKRLPAIRSFPHGASSENSGTTGLPLHVRPIRFSMISASTRKTMDGMLTASQGGQVLISPRFENRPFRM